MLASLTMNAWKRRRAIFTAVGLHRILSDLLRAARELMVGEKDEKYVR
jgi:hypothetical protein